MKPTVEWPGAVVVTPTCEMGSWEPSGALTITSWGPRVRGLRPTVLEKVTLKL